MPNYNRRNAIIWWIVKKVGDSLKLIMLTLELCYSLYVRVREIETGNWRGAQSVGFSKSDVCTDTSVTYHVELFNVELSSTVENFQPMCGDSRAFNSLGDICFQEDDFHNCLSAFQSFQSVSSVSSFTSQFDSIDYSYFPNILYMTLISFVCIILTLLYESDQSRFGDDLQGQINSRMDKYIMVKVNFMLTGCLVILILTSRSFFTNIRSEDCFDLYNPSSSEDDLCFAVQSCSANLCVVINPEDFFIANYKSINLFLAIMIIVGLVTKWLVKRIDATQVNRVMTGADYLDYMLRMRSSRWNRTMGLSQNDGFNPVSYLDLSSHWDKLSEEEIKECSDDCTICLLPLHALKPKTPSNIDDCGQNPTESTRNMNRNHLSNRNGSSRQDLPNNTSTYQRLRSQYRIHPEDFDRAFALNPSEIGTNNNELTNQQQEEPSQASELQPSSTLEEASFGFEDKDVEEGSTGLIEVVRVPCGHLFHAGCIEQWSSSNHVTCPVCRKNLRRPTPTAASFSASTRVNEGQAVSDIQL